MLTALPASAVGDYFGQQAQNRHEQEMAKIKNLKPGTPIANPANLGNPGTGNTYKPFNAYTMQGQPVPITPSKNYNTAIGTPWRQSAQAMRGV